MKVIAKANDSTYICEVSHTELEKFMDKFYGNMSKLAVGDELNLGQGYDFSTRIESACKSMVEASKQFGSAQKVMTDYALAIAKGAGEQA
jgi:hypothetical protein